MLPDCGKGLGNHIGPRNEVGFGFRDLIVDLLRHRFGAVGYPALDFADLDGDPCGCLFRSVDHALICGRKGLLDRLCALGEFGRALVGARDDLLLGLVEDACDIARAGDHLLFGFVEDGNT